MQINRKEPSADFLHWTAGDTAGLSVLWTQAFTVWSMCFTEALRADGAVSPRTSASHRAAPGTATQGVSIAGIDASLCIHSGYSLSTLIFTDHWWAYEVWLMNQKSLDTMHQ